MTNKTYQNGKQRIWVVTLNTPEYTGLTYYFGANVDAVQSIERSFPGSIVREDRETATRMIILEGKQIGTIDRGFIEKSAVTF